MGELIQYVMGSRYLIGLLFILTLVFFEFIRYRKETYYNNDFLRYPQMQNHILNSQFGLYKNSNINCTRINKIFFLSTSFSIFIGGLIMIFNILLGLIVYILISTASVYFTNKYIVKEYAV